MKAFKYYKNPNYTLMELKKKRKKPFNLELWYNMFVLKDLVNII